jgi:hypothetical protein
MKRLRPERRFPSREELIRQICSDVDTAREFFHIQEHESPNRRSVDYKSVKA